MLTICVPYSAKRTSKIPRLLTCNGSPSYLQTLHFLERFSSSNGVKHTLQQSHDPHSLTTVPIPYLSCLTWVPGLIAICVFILFSCPSSIFAISDALETPSLTQFTIMDQVLGDFAHIARG